MGMVVISLVILELFPSLKTSKIVLRVKDSYSKTDIFCP